MSRYEDAEVPGFRQPDPTQWPAAGCGLTG